MKCGMGLWNIVFANLHSTNDNRQAYLYMEIPYLSIFYFKSHDGMIMTNSADFENHDNFRDI